MKKPNIRSIRFSDELAELIDQQIGETFTEKFENLVTRCVWAVPAKEAELERIDRRIEEKRQQLRELSDQAWELRRTIGELLPKVSALESAIDSAVKKWDM